MQELQQEVEEAKAAASKAEQEWQGVRAEQQKLVSEGSQEQEAEQDGREPRASEVLHALQVAVEAVAKVPMLAELGPMLTQFRSQCPGALDKVRALEEAEQHKAS
eukprot:15439693-Alexandrium_andersonii.AAC.1